MKLPHAKIRSYLSYKSLFSNVLKNGILLPISYLNDPANTETLVDQLIINFENSEAIGYSSFFVLEKS